MREVPARRRILWQDFELDVQLRRLHRAGQRIALQPIPFQILAMLVERPGELVTRDELHHKIWNGYSYGDFDHSLNIAISKLRTSLGDSAKEPQYIETLPQIGYRFIAEVVAQEDAEASDVANTLVAPPRAGWVKRAMVLGSVAIAVVLAAYWMGSRYVWPSERGDSAGEVEAARPEGVGIPPGRVAYIHPTELARRPFRFTGTGADYVRIPNSPLLEPEQVSVDAWVRSAGPPGKYRYIVAKGAYDCGGSSYALYTGVNRGLVFYVAGPPKLLMLASPPASAEMWDGKWHHVVGTYDGTRVRLFVDGAEIGYGTAASEPMKIMYGLPTNNDLLVGNYVGGCTAPFEGEVAEVQVFDRAISQTEIATLYKTGVARYGRSSPLNRREEELAKVCLPPPAGLIAHWTGERDLREVIEGQQPLQVGGVNRMAGKVGVGIEFLGDGHLEFRDAAQLNLTGPLTMEGWVFYKGYEVAPEEGAILAAKWAHPTLPRASYGLFVRQNATPYFEVSSDGVKSSRAEATLPLVVELTHIAGVWDGTTVRLYANGVQVASAPFSGPIRGGPGPLYLGGRNNTATGKHESIAGTLDEFGVYNRALTEKEIRAIYRAGSQGKCR